MVGHEIYRGVRVLRCTRMNGVNAGTETTMRRKKKATPRDKSDLEGLPMKTNIQLKGYWMAYAKKSSTGAEQHQIYWSPNWRGGGNPPLIKILNA